MVEDPKGTQDFSRDETMGDVTRGAQYHNTRYTGIPGTPVLENTTYSDIEDIDTNKENNNDEASTNDADANMGCQSQTRKGAIKAAKAAATGRKTKHKRYKQQSLFAKEAFDPLRHCIMCAAWHKVNQGIMDKSAIPHKGHHNRCPKKKPDKRALNMDKIMKLNAAWNNTPIVKTPGTRKEGGDIRTMIGTTPDAATTQPNNNATDINPVSEATTPSPVPNPTNSSIELMKDYMHLGTMLRNVLETEMKKFETDVTY